MCDQKNRSSLVSFSKHGSLLEEDEEQLQICISAQAGARRRSSCCAFTVPIPFERSTSTAYLNPKFDSEILEEQFKSSSFPQIKLRFRFALFYILVFSISWIAYFFTIGINGFGVNYQMMCTIFSTVFLLDLLILYITFLDTFRIYMIHVSIVTAGIFCMMSIALVSFFKHETLKEIHFIGDISKAGHFSICMQIIIIIYTMIPLPLYLSVGITSIYSVLFETISILKHNQNDNIFNSGLIVRALLQISVHIIGVHILLMTIVRMRGTFMKIGQSLLVRKQLEMEKLLKEKMIHSIIPPKVADWLMSETGKESENIPKRNNSISRNSNPGASDLKSLFRPFNMHCMENVSILFADIVGFTKMSSNKTAEELVNILNDLFERFDDLCQIHNCEKISTLGDCYYCVSGCPEPRSDHAKCCVEMGLGMITAIKCFDEQRGEGVNMRVGVHTGTVLCGIVGTKRFKFDVWSNDVTLANKMESTGKPGRVHISEETSRFLTDYILEDGEDVFGHKTYFIEGRLQSPCLKENRLSKCGENKPLTLTVCPPQLVESEIIISDTTSPTVSMSLAPDMFNFGENEVPLTPPVHNPNHLSPSLFHLKVKASSLPSILDQENDKDRKSEKNDESSKSSISIGNNGKYTNKYWKILKLFHKTENYTFSPKLNEDENVITVEVSPLTSNEYQEVPIVIETRESLKQSNLLQSELSCPRNSNVSINENVKSYINQSRCDVSPFTKSRRYKSQHGITSNLEVIQPGSAKISTGTSQIQNSPGISKNVRPVSDDNDAQLSPIVNSRKDFGIQSMSQRSNIQQQIYMASQSALGTSQELQRRVSGYCSSSQLSLAQPILINNTQPEAYTFKTRKQFDLQLIKCIQDNAKSRCCYFVKPSISPFTLFFTCKDMENNYRTTAHRADKRDSDCLPTLATSRFNTYLDVVVSTLIFIIISVAIFILYDYNIFWIGIFTISLLLQTFALGLCFYSHSTLSKTSLQFLMEEKPFYKVLYYLSNWYPWHFLGGIFLSLPVISVLVNFTCNESGFTSTVSGNQSYYFCLLCISWLHFCNFIQINLWVKNSLVMLSGVIFIAATIICCSENMSTNDTFSTSVSSHIMSNLSQVVSEIQESELLNNVVRKQGPIKSSIIGEYIKKLPINITESHNVALIEKHFIYSSEIYLNVILVVILVWILNRELEISYRMSFYGNVVANRDKLNVQNMRNQADLLLHNIIPRHVAYQLKNTAKYSENHKNVGIIFASIVNFDEMYDESYLSGKEYLRVLNELIGDFDELLEHLEFRSVNKIKTIGSTFMAASGLNPHIREEYSDPHAHLYELMNFTIAMQKVVQNFNRDLLEFNLILRVGYNFGDVTAGVIGNSKLYYDIWGDAVNIASRMDSTGVNSRIQVEEACIEVLEKEFEFEPRGSVYVKGKDNMNVFLLLRKRNSNNVAL